jgi:hypothetical protein
MLGRLVTLAAYQNAMQAALVKNQLEAAGIRAVLDNEHTASNFWHLSNAIGGIKVQVAEEDFERASVVLDELEGKIRHVDEKDDERAAADSTTESEHEETGAEAPEPKPGEDDEPDDPPLNAREDSAERAYRTVLIGYVVWPLQLYAAWLLADVWQSDLPMRPAIQRRLYWTIALHLPMLLIALLVIGLFLRGVATPSFRGY